jgi:AcrR family transcriptional regulator
MKITTRRHPQQARARAKVQLITNAALAIINEEGTSALNTDRIAEAAGISVGTVYRYFPDKKSILLKVYSDALDELFAALQSAAHLPTLPPTWNDFCDRISSEMTQNERRYAAILRIRSTMMYVEFADLDRRNADRIADLVVTILRHYGSKWPERTLRKLALYGVYLSDSAWHYFWSMEVYDPLVDQWRIEALRLILGLAFGAEQQFLSRASNTHLPLPVAIGVADQSPARIKNKIKK